MGCRNDYMAANEREIASRRFCRMLDYLFVAIGREVPAWAAKGKDEYYGAPEHVNDATVLMCAAIREMSDEQRELVIYDAHSPVARELATFWEQHEAEDRKREAKETADAEAQRKRDEAELERLKRKLGRE